MAIVRHGVVSIWAALLISITGVAWAASSLEVEAFDVEQVPRILPGARLNFSLFGTPGASATLHIEGASFPIELRELQPGVYEGSYLIDERDHIAPDGRVIAFLRRGEQVVSSMLAEPLQLGASPPVAAAAQAAPPARADRRACDDCALVESIRPVEVGGVPAFVGVVAGGVLRALRRQGAQTQYDVVLRLPNGARQLRRYHTLPPFEVGETIRLDEQ